MTERFLVQVSRADASAPATVTLLAGEQELMFPMRAADPKKPARFTVGEPGHRSSVWRLWANKDRGDVYLGTRQSAGIFKVSLHESGDWRLQFISENPADRGQVRFTPERGREPQGRILSRWRRPAAGRTGWTEALSIWVPSEDLITIPNDDQAAEGVRWMTPAPTGCAVEFRVFLVEPNQGGVDLSAGLIGAHATLGLLDGFTLATGEVVLIFLATSQLSAQLHTEIAERLERQRQVIPANWDLSPTSGPRAAIYSFDPDDHFNIWDLSLLRGRA